MLDYKKYTFWLTFALCYLFGGTLVYLGVPFRLYYVILFPLLVIILYIFNKKKIIFNNVIIICIVYLSVIILSGINNDSPIINILKYLRFIVIPMIIYLFTMIVVNKNNINKIIKFSIIIALIQLPIIIFQKLNYEILTQLSPTNASSLSSSKLDFDFGTFFWKDDAAMTMFLLFIISFVLFDKKHNSIVKYKNMILIWLSITILIANSMIGHFILLFLFIYYVLKHISIKKTIKIIFSIMVLSGILILSGYANLWSSQIKKSIDQITFKDATDAKIFLEGNYARSAAIVYYFNQPIKIIGDGPSSSYNPVTRKYLLGNTGIFLLTYSEIGLIGLIMVLVLLYSISHQPMRTSKTMGRPIFIILCMYSVTSSVLTDSSMIFACTIFASTGLISNRLQSL